MKFVCISDTHCEHWGMDMPEGDVLLCAGDISLRGNEIQTSEFNYWLGGLDYQYKIVVPGNHDFGFQTHPGLFKAILSEATVLMDEAIVINGIKIYGTPWQPKFNNWAFGLERKSPEMQRAMDAIPEDTNILITHAPPYGILDEVPKRNSAGTPIGMQHIGCETLRASLEKRFPELRYHLFGHIHESGGVEMVTMNNRPTWFINATIADKHHDPNNLPKIFHYEKS